MRTNEEMAILYEELKEHEEPEEIDEDDFRDR
jgi:hypothetical protein